MNRGGADGEQMAHRRSEGGIRVVIDREEGQWWEGTRRDFISLSQSKPRGGGRISGQGTWAIRNTREQ